MHPFLIDWTVQGHHLRVPTYGALLAFSFSVAYFLSLRRAIKLDEDPRHVENLFLLIVLSSILGSRLFHVLFEEPVYYWNHPAKIFAVWEGGYTLYGAMLLSILSIFVYTGVKKINRFLFADIAAEVVSLGIAIGRMGCFFAGCCWGRPSNLPWSVTFANAESFTEFKNIPVHPTQVYEALGALFIYFYVLWLMRRKKYDGQLFFHALALYSILRFIVELFRGDVYRGYVISNLLSYAQLISLLVFAGSIVGILVLRKRPLTIKNEESSPTH